MGFNDTALEYQVQEALPAGSLGAANALFQQVVTYGSPNFLAFLCGNFLGVFIQMFERIYLNAAMDVCYITMEDGLEFIIRMVKRFTPSFLKKKDDEILSNLSLTHMAGQPLIHAYSTCFLTSF